MKPHRLRTLAWKLALTALVALAPSQIGCFSLKEPPCAFTCVQPPRLCPPNYTCETDGLCHRVGAAAACALTAPPASDGGASADTSDDTRSDLDDPDGPDAQD